MFCMKLADVNIAVSARFVSTHSFCREYASAETPAFFVEITAQDIQQERIKAHQQMKPEEIPPSGLPDPHVERQALLRKISEKMPQYDRMLMHGSAIMVDGKAYMFTAPSGTGKSTHARLWRKMLPERAVMINDDKPFVGYRNGQFYVYGSPWQGKHHLGDNISAPLAGICILSQAPENSIKRLSPSEALCAILQQCYQPVEATAVLQTLDLIEKLLAVVPIYQLSCNMDISAAELSYNTMAK